MTDNELRDLWRKHGGRFFGPKVETGAMPEAQLLPFLRSLTTSPASGGVDAGLTIDALAQEIRRVDGSHSLGAGALAEALMPFLIASISPPAPTSGTGATWPHGCKDRAACARNHGCSHVGCEHHQRVISAEIAAEIDRVFSPAPAPAAGGVDAVAAEFWTPWRISFVLQDCATYLRTLYARHNIGPAQRGIDPDKLDAASRGLAMPSREWLREKIASDPNIEDCGAKPTSGPEAGGEAMAVEIGGYPPLRVASEFARKFYLNNPEGSRRELIEALDGAISAYVELQLRQQHIKRAAPASSPAGGVREALPAAIHGIINDHYHALGPSRVEALQQAAAALFPATKDKD